MFEPPWQVQRAEDKPIATTTWENNSPYRVIFCHVRKRDQERFLAALKELPDKMMLLGYTDYLDACRAIWGNRKSHNEKEVTDCDAVRTTEQA